MSHSHWEYSLRKIFGEVGLTLITQVSKKKGGWKLGKTDFALWLTEDLKRFGIISEFASNIDTHGFYPQITDFITLKQWLYGNRNVKLYIFDELNYHAPRRRAMSTKNINILQLFPEISKARARLIGIGQDILGVDKDLLNLQWIRAIYIKKTLKNVELVSHLVNKVIRFRNVPATTIYFDPLEVAPFYDRPKGNVLFKDTEQQLLYDWSTGKSFKELGLHPMSLNRLVRKFVRTTLEQNQPSHFT